MKVCSGCKHKCIQFEGKQDSDSKLICNNSESVLGAMYGKCLNGNTELFVQFYSEYGDKPKDSYATLEYSCYEDTEINKSLDGLIKMATDLLDKVKEDNSQNK